MIGELSNCYEVLGLRPGSSPEELKAAHRDLAKVWHSDRFGHDPRLQAKAQEKLKEINEAYNHLISRRLRRASQPNYRSHSRSQDGTSARRPEAAGNRRAEAAATKAPMRWLFTVAIVLVFGLGFMLTTRSLLTRNQQLNTRTVAVGEDRASKENPTDGREKAEAVAKPTLEQTSKEQITGSGATEPSVEEPMVKEPAVATETVLIDTTTGLLARADCPLKSRTTYASGNQPVQYCHAAHPKPTPKDSKIKSAGRRIASPGEWFGAKKSAPSSQESQ